MAIAVSLPQVVHLCRVSAALLAAVLLAACYPEEVDLPGSDQLTTTAETGATARAAAQLTSTPVPPTSTPQPIEFSILDELGDCNPKVPNCWVDLVRVDFRPFTCGDAGSVALKANYAQYVDAFCDPERDPLGEMQVLPFLLELISGTAPEPAAPLDFLICLEANLDGDLNTGLKSGGESGAEVGLCLSTGGGEAVLLEYDSEGEVVQQALLAADALMAQAEGSVMVALPLFADRNPWVGSDSAGSSSLLITACQEPSTEGGQLACDSVELDFNCRTEPLYYDGVEFEAYACSAWEE